MAMPEADPKQLENTGVFTGPTGERSKCIRVGNGSNLSKSRLFLTKGHTNWPHSGLADKMQRTPHTKARAQVLQGLMTFNRLRNKRQ